MVAFLLLFLLTPTLSGDDFDFGLTYYLLNDPEMARSYFNRFFVNTNNQRVADAYVELFKGNNWDAAERFRRYLEMNHRSLIGIIGMALSTRDLLNSTSLETLERAQRLHPKNPAVHVAIGFEYVKRKDYPKAEQFFARALNSSKEEIYKIPLGYLYLEMNEYKEVLDMCEKSALADKQSFHFNYLTAKAHYHLNNWQGVGQFIQNAIKAKPGHIVGRLLWAQFLASQNQAVEARDALKGMQFDGYNLEYEKTLAQVLFKLEDRQAYGKMLEVLLQSPWDREINRIMGLHHLREAKGENIQHWINRALIAGNPESDMKSLFPGKYIIKSPFELSFFSVESMSWFDDQFLVVAGKRESGDKDKVFVIDSKNGKIVATGTVSGDILQVKTSGNNGGWAVIVTVAKENQRVYLYSLTYSGNSFVTKQIPGGSYGMPSLISGFSSDGQTFYFVSSHVSEAIYRAPFTVLDNQFQQQALFPNLPVPVYALTRKGGAPIQIKGNDQYAKLPIKEMRDYALLSKAYQKDELVQSMITEGFSIDLAASRTVKVYCNDTSDGAVVYTTDVDAKRGFDAVLYSAIAKDKSIRLNETAFLGKNKYSEIKVIAYNPIKCELIVQTLDENKQLLHHNAKGKLTRLLGDNLLSQLYLPHSNILYYLVEKKQKLFEKETQLFQVTLNRYSKTRVKKRDDIIAISMSACGEAAEFVTFNGEILTLDLENEFIYQKPALNTIMQAISSLGNRAAFVNERVVIGI